MQRSHGHSWLVLLVATLTLAACVPANQRPVADFTVLPATGSVATVFTFDGSASNDPDGSIATYSWDFDDGTTATTKTAQHTFTTPGTFDVTLTVKDNGGLTHSRTQQVTVGEAGTVRGYVVNRKGGTKVAGTIVTVEGAGGASTVTDADGYYSIDATPGMVSLRFEQAGYAQARVEGLAVTADAITYYDTIQQEAFDPFLPVEAPTLTLDRTTGEVVTVDPADDTFEVTVSGSIAEPNVNGFVFLNAALGQAGGSSGHLNRSSTGTTLATFDGTSTTLKVPATGFDGVTTLYVVAYDVNGNRIEHIVSVDVTSATAGGADLGEVSNAFASAITFGDTSVFGTLGGSPGFAAGDLLQALRAGDRDAIREQSQRLDPGSRGPTASAYLDEVITWVDLTFDYDLAAHDAPTAFEVYRQLAGEAEEHLIGRFSPTRPGVQLGPTTFLYRDASGSLSADVEATYRVAAVTGGSAGPAPADGSDVASTTPLAALYVNADSPADGENAASVDPTYALSFDGRSEELYFAVIVLDRVHSEGNFVEWVSPLLLDTSGAVDVNLPHNFDLSASNTTLQPFHAYDWQPIAATARADGTAISVAADFFDVLGTGFGSSDGPVNTFLTGDGTF